MTDTFALTNKTAYTPQVPFERIKDDILGTRYELSLALVGDARMRALSTAHKGNADHVNVLSFPLSTTEGEIIINPRQAARDARDYGHTADEHIMFLFIHACLHLKGHTHGTTMEQLEDYYLNTYLKSNTANNGAQSA